MNARRATLFYAALVGVLVLPFASELRTPQAPMGVKIAFIGDQGAADADDDGREQAPEVLKLIKDEGAHAVVHQGDFDYNHDPDAWDAMIDNVLGSDFPYFGSAGNHDVEMWDGYQKKLEDRARRIGISWDGRMGVKASLNFRGVFIVLSAVDVIDTGHTEYVREQLARDESIWRVCSWHKNQRAMQVGGKASEPGWDIYEEARRGGAIIATGHEHSYSRSHLLSDIAERTVADRSDTLHLERGKTFVVVSGIAGKSMRRIRQLPIGDWWAKYYTTDNASNYGALFGTFGVGGRPNVAEFYFKDVAGRVIDRFTVVSRLIRSTGTGTSGSEALLEAADDGELETVNRLLAEGAPVDGRDDEGRTPLMLALDEGETEVARALIAAGANVTAVDGEGWTTLMYAAAGGDVALIRELAGKGVDVNARANDGATALLEAAAAESPSALVEVLMGLGADTRVRDQTGRTPLLVAAAEGNRPDVIVLAKHADVDTRDREGNTALMLLAYKAAAAQAVDALIAAGADVNAANAEGRTVLMCAADGGSPDVVRRLLAAGARVNARDDLGRTALMWGAHGRAAPTEAAHRAILDALLAAGADPALEDHEGRSAAAYANAGGYGAALATK
jgi:ankyrin repeat protein